MSDEEFDELFEKAKPGLTAMIANTEKALEFVPEGESIPYDIVDWQVLDDKPIDS